MKHRNYMMVQHNEQSIKRKASERHDFFEWKVNKRKKKVSSAAGDVQNRE